jgi:hypothetical protein
MGFLGRPDKGQLLTALRQFKATIETCRNLEQVKAALSELVEALEKAFA